MIVDTLKFFPETKISKAWSKKKNVHKKTQYTKTNPFFFMKNLGPKVSIVCFLFSWWFPLFSSFHSSFWSLPPFLHLYSRVNKKENEPHWYLVLFRLNISQQWLGTWAHAYTKHTLRLPWKWHSITTHTHLGLYRTQGKRMGRVNITEYLVHRVGAKRKGGGKKGK